MRLIYEQHYVRIEETTIGPKYIISDLLPVLANTHRCETVHFRLVGMFSVSSSFLQLSSSTYSIINCTFHIKNNITFFKSCIIKNEMIHLMCDIKNFSMLLRYHWNTTYSKDSIISTVSIKRTVWDLSLITLLNVLYDLNIDFSIDKSTVSIKRTVWISGTVS